MKEKPTAFPFLFQSDPMTEPKHPDDYLAFELVEEGGESIPFELFDGIRDTLDGMIRNGLFPFELKSGPITFSEIDAIMCASDAMFALNQFVSGEVDYTEPQDRELSFDLCLACFITMKIRDQQIYEQTNDVVARCRELMEMLTKDNLRPKRQMIAELTAIKNEATRCIKAAKDRHAKPFTFDEPPELYRSRVDTRESPGGFFERVYRRHVPGGLIPVQIRYHDEAYYDVLHVWCTRQGVSMRSLFERPMPELLTTKQRARRDRKAQPTP